MRSKTWLLLVLVVAVHGFDLEAVLKRHEIPVEKSKHALKQSKLRHTWNDTQVADTFIVHAKDATEMESLALSAEMRVVKHLSKLGNYFVLEPTEELLRKRVELDHHVKNTLGTSPRVHWVERELIRTYTKYAITDPSFTRQWHLKNSAVTGADANVVAAWDLGVTGKGVQIAIVDDGYQTTHPDLAPGFVAADSFNYNNNNNNPNPVATTDNHGTACAGVAGARDDGVSCGVGAAYRASLAGVRTIAGPISTAGIASAITHSNQNNDIYSCSWGIPDCVDGTNGIPTCRLVTQARLQQEALDKNVKEGRGGLGGIYVFAAGNSRQEQSDTNYQDFPRSIQVIAVAAFTNQGVFSFYSDPGAGLLVAAPSNGGPLGITTSDRTGTVGYAATDCTNTFGGTSSATPLVAGIIALMLEKNPDLTWRDVQDIIAHTSKKIDEDDPGWQTNGGDLHVSHDYGFGAIDAAAAVKAADDRTVHLTCDKSATSDTTTANLPIPDNNPTGVESKMKVSGITEIEQIEHTIVKVNIQHAERGDLLITLVSPAGTESILAKPRNDLAPNYVDWEFKTNFNWDESPNGEWTLKVADRVAVTSGTLTNWSLRFHGKCPGEGQGKKLSNGAIIGIVFGVMVGIVIIAAIGFIIYKKRQ